MICQWSNIEAGNVWPWIFAFLNGGKSYSSVEGIERYILKAIILSSYFDRSM